MRSPIRASPCCARTRSPNSPVRPPISGSTSSRTTSGRTGSASTGPSKSGRLLDALRPGRAPGTLTAGTRHGGLHRDRRHRRRCRRLRDTAGLSRPRLRRGAQIANGRVDRVSAPFPLEFHPTKPGRDTKPRRMAAALRAARRFRARAPSRDSSRLESATPTPRHRRPFIDARASVSGIATPLSRPRASPAREQVGLHDLFSYAPDFTDSKISGISLRSIGSKSRRFR